MVAGHADWHTWKGAGGDALIGSGRAGYELPKILDRAGKALLKHHRGLPAKLFLRERNVRFALEGVVGGEGGGAGTVIEPRYSHECRSVMIGESTYEK